MKIRWFYLECWKTVKCNESRWSLRNKKAAWPRKNSCVCNKNEWRPEHTERNAPVSWQRPRSAARCDISLFRYQVGRKTCLTLQINTSLREGERGHSPNQSARCQEHLGQHLAAVPFSPQRAQTKAVVRRWSQPGNSTKQTWKRPLVMEKGIAVFQKYPSVMVFLDPQAPMCMGFYSGLLKLWKKKAIIYSIDIWHFGWTMRKFREE